MTVMNTYTDKRCTVEMLRNGRGERGGVDTCTHAVMVQDQYCAAIPSVSTGRKQWVFLNAWRGKN